MRHDRLTRAILECGMDEMNGRDGLLPNNTLIERFEARYSFREVVGRHCRGAVFGEGCVRMQVCHPMYPIQFVVTSCAPALVGFRHLRIIEYKRESYLQTS